MADIASVSHTFYLLLCNICLFVFYLPEITEPLNELSRIVLVELDIREIDFQNGGTRIANIEKHQFGLP